MFMLLRFLLYSWNDANVAFWLYKEQDSHSLLINEKKIKSLRPDQHSGSSHNWGEIDAFVTTSKNGCGLLLFSVLGALGES